MFAPGNGPVLRENLLTKTTLCYRFGSHCFWLNMMSIFSCYFNFCRWLSWLYYIPRDEYKDFRSSLLMFCALAIYSYLLLYFSFPLRGLNILKFSYTDRCAFQKSCSTFSIWGFKHFSFKENTRQLR